ncbi:MAG: hypothetical protein A2921_03790 [Candidatus Magasanikbacteria bacterium RIFCSPLOWO2_01_FULL_43_20b]|uniref:DUF4367 domain-containing protein n=1 Tax=Candidatus Magasanikbacteria bacterium RIFCSPLOWO2_12_FULL_43_12 TaxID=1798692 RepID=A0A1F6MRD0_9BACT|nr:MAG: hypothetical protein A3C74_00095 [Candidatus Magasanikbacteria bacterium RIFCSPHIGHO2_02_FULL_44_13]OGH72523.1 MAG: hypothetical protein A3I93_04380 [Candidatus Magasanikbacteria bacterium RIFCSPLOWO2_02_FULL_43_22]OGH73694.1 MAG: hypothetical protein A2921_03790 [Candidatus Magasanikbacteria bacterium RIFCSPLOWO2_01_FULL_43_20b]OGH74108.1 MAG: hypothetical protein A3G00_05050 [Candidatus Magasanikbacteria bacterium RIFCSPLOWO2_12_FULL_43_12]
MNQKSLITILGFIVIILIGAIIYFTTINKTSQPTNGTASWQTHQNEKFGIEFEYPPNIQFDSGDENSNGWYNVSANYDNSGDNFFSFTVLDKVEGMENINSLKYRDKNLFVANELNFQNGKFITVDGYGTANYYFVAAYYEGKDYVYHFMMSRPDHSKDMLELFEKILVTARLTK